MNKSIYEIIKDKESGKTGLGVRIFDNITDEHIEKIINETITETVKKIRLEMDLGTDEEEKLYLIKAELDSLDKLSNNKKSKKIRI